MVDEINNAKDGLSALLAAIPGLRVLDYPADSVNELPAAMVLVESRDAAGALGGGAFTGRIKVVLLVSSANIRQAYDTLNRFIDPLGPQSVETAVDADNTWGGAVDDGRLLSVDNIGPRKLAGVSCVGADFHLRFVKTIRA